MTWMLQPHNWSQAIRPNYYNIGYRRSGTYKGMGALGQGCDVLTDPTCGITSLQQTELQQTYPGMLSSTAISPGGTTTNWLPWILGGALVLVLIGGRR